MFEKDIHYSLNIESAVIGICLIEREAFGKIYQAIEAENFYNSFHQKIFFTIKEMYINSIPIDLYTVADQIVRVHGVNNFGGINVPAFLVGMTKYVVNSTHIEYHSWIIKTMWMEREIIKLTSGQTKLEGNAQNKIKELQDKLFNLQQRTTVHDWHDMTHLMVELYQHQEEMRITQGIGLQSGIPTLDRINGGFHAGQMIVLGARPSMGKSALIGSIALHMAKNKKSVGIISLEMSNNEIAARLAAIDTDTDFSILYRGLYRDEIETQKVYERIGAHTSALPIYVSDRTDVDIVQIKAKAEKLKSLHGLDCLIIDYLQLIDAPETYNRNRENEIAKISRFCKLMAKDMNVPVILLCQLNREVTKRHGDARYPQLSDIRESGSIEQDADVVFFIHRDYMAGIQVDQDGRSTEYEADLIIRKWRNGKSNFIVPLDFDPPKMKFTERKALTWKPIDVEYPNNQ